jgi:hypothetical protein
MAHNFRFWRLEEDQHLRLSTPSLPEQRSGRLFLALFFEAATLPKAVDWVPVPSQQQIAWYIG